MRLLLPLVVIVAFAALVLHPVAGASPSATGGKMITIGLVADSHYDTFPAGEKAPWEPLPHWFREQVQRTTTTTKRRYDIAKDKMDEAISVFNAIPEMTLVVNLGDLVNNDMMWNLPPILDRFNEAKAPHYHLLGNHDLRAHNDQFGKLNKTQSEWVKNKFGLQEWYYSLDHPPFTFLFLDSMALEPESNDQQKKKEHIEWVQNQLNEAKEKKRVVIIFAHIPIGFQTNILAPVLKTYDHIALAFFGHNHKGGYLIQGKTHCVTLNGQIETMTNAFGVVEVFSDRAELTGFGRVPTRVMSFTPETTTLLQQYDGPVAHDLTQQGNQPLPPRALWKSEVLQRPPPLLLNIPSYNKPVLPVTEPNPGETRFLRDTYKFWSKRIRTPSPEEPVDLTSAVKGKDPTILSPEPLAMTSVEPAKLPRDVIEDPGSSSSHSGSTSHHQQQHSTHLVQDKRRDVLTESGTTLPLDRSAFVFGYLLMVPVVVTVGGAILLLVQRRRNLRRSTSKSLAEI